MVIYILAGDVIFCLWLVAIQNKQEKKLKRDEACAQATMNRKQSEDIFQHLENYMQVIN